MSNNFAGCYWSELKAVIGWLKVNWKPVYHFNVSGGDEEARDWLTQYAITAAVAKAG